MRRAARGILTIGLIASLPACTTGLVGRQGSALAAGGLQSQAILTLTEVKVGDEVLFALPAFDNRTGDAVTIESVRVLKVPTGFEVLGYRTLKYTQTDGMMLDWDSRTSKDPSRPLATSERGVKGLVVPAKSVGERYALVHARVTARPAEALENVEVVYEQRGTTYHQEMVGTWRVTMVGEPHTAS